MRIVVAIGGNALLKRGQPLEADIQKQNVMIAAENIAQMAQHHQIIIVHGNGPQIGLLALQAANYTEVAPYPLDILNAQSQGMIGYLLMQALRNLLPQVSIATLLTQIVVEAHDPAFQNPTKFIGPVYSRAEAEKLAKKYSWKMGADGNYLRRVVPSPLPQHILELPIIDSLITQNRIVICCGGGGIAVAPSPTRGWQGIEAIIDKDLSAALLAIQLNADRLVILTDIHAVQLNWNTPKAKPLYKTSVNELLVHNFALGSMAPKIAAVCQFVQATGKTAAIGALSEGIAVANGNAGTQIGGGAA